MAPKWRTGGVLSVDIAHRRYADNGIAFLDGGSDVVQLIKADDLRVKDPPTPEGFAAALNTFCDREGVSVLLLDGPQGWREPKSQIEHMRLCERVLNTPGKTGVFGTVKPSTYLPYIKFSIELFHQLRIKHDWELLRSNWNKRPWERWLVESFPTAAWKTLGLKNLPAKSKCTSDQLIAWRNDLSTLTGLKLPDVLTHDELQAVVVLPLGRAMVKGDESQVILSGVDPYLTKEGVVLEGLIANPRMTD
ncbi:MAG: hypothetical protein AMJ88_15150 [Anaerolineae bacterium SM23_ 63]|nr:MAG: hypothetical protein AMJ88_15150 [Anaerolineae bacterium SM23_ 63]